MAKKKTSSKATARSRSRFVARVPIHFPAPKDLDRVLEAGGYPGLDPEEAADIKGREKTIAAGKPCDKLPEYVLRTALANGWIEDLADDDEGSDGE